MKKMTSCLYATLFSTILLIAPLSNAATPQWTVIPDKSTLTFTATQNGAPVTGNFKTFTGDIAFDPEKMNGNKVKINIDMNSVDTSYTEMSDTLKKAEWFSIKIFPQAIFTADKFTKIADGKYTAEGTVTIRDKTVPTTLAFSLKKEGANMLAEGSTTLKRNNFGVGQGDWESTKEIKNEVLVKFTLVAQPH
jgi:polyisoprenoid-binding protein YceI